MSSEFVSGDWEDFGHENRCAMMRGYAETCPDPAIKTALLWAADEIEKFWAYQPKLESAVEDCEASLEDARGKLNEWAQQVGEDMDHWLAEMKSAREAKGVYF